MKKEIIVFGTGAYFENYMACYGLDRKPYWAVDNDRSRQGTSKLGVEIHAPEELALLAPDSFYMIICSSHVSEMKAQLEGMGIFDYQSYHLMDTESLCDVESELFGKPKYKIGYVPGVFDLFHVGHLNLLHKSKMRCEYLIAGVLTDELVEFFKKKRPLIPYAQRAAIVTAIEYVDRVVPVDFSNTYKIDAWKLYHYDCHFSGNDHGADWEQDLRQLREVGANMEFFEYTRSTSSTRIKAELGK